MAWSGHWGAAHKRCSPTSIEQPESDKQLKNNASNLPEIAPEHRERIKQINERLLAVFGYPEWRQPLPAVDELVCTFLSQNTNDINRDKAFQAIKTHYASWEEVRDADPQEFIQVIRIAGLANQKGPNIQQALRKISEKSGQISLDWLKEMPLEEARQWLLSLKGVGRKTAAIVLLFSLGKPAFPVDTHIFRVSGRIGLRPAGLSIEKVHDYLEAAADPQDYAALHLNLIRLGREFCHAHKPECFRCPIVDLCQYPHKNLD